MSDRWRDCAESLARWSELTLDDMVFAYRKAKADCFFERAVSVARLFAAYEEDLEGNLQRLLTRLAKPKKRAGLRKDRALLGSELLIAKKLALEARETPLGPDGAFFADRQRAFEHLKSSHRLTAEFRVAAELPVDFHVLSALWVNRVGHRFDACLEDRAYGARLRRYGDDGSPNARPYHLRALGSMPPYFRAYRRWREDGLAAMRRELEAGQRIVCLTLDIRNYFHRIDPSFGMDEAFHAALGLGQTDAKGHAAGRALSKVDRELTSLVCHLLKAWAGRSREFVQRYASVEAVKLGGIPIGVTAARVLANVLLQPLDRYIVENLAPIYYGRYVDDMFLVLRDPGGSRSAADLMDHIARHLPEGVFTKGSAGRDGERCIKLGNYQGGTELVLQDSKNKAFFLAGRAGLDLLDVIRSEIRDLASERRLLPEAGFLAKKTSAQVLAASNDARQQADTLRKADGLSIRRMGWAIQLRWAETLALDLPPDEWTREREDFFRFARDHVLRPERLLDHMDYLPRLLGLAIACEDWSGARKLIDETSRAVRELESLPPADHGIRINGYSVSKDLGEVWIHFRRSLGSTLCDAVLRAWPLGSAPGDETRDEETDERVMLWQALGREFPAEGHTSAWQAVGEEVRALAWRDLARRPLKELWRDHWHSLAARDWQDDLGGMAEAFGGPAGDPQVIRGFLTGAVQFLGRSPTVPSLGPHPGPSVRPFLFPTRPFSLREIAEWDPACVGLSKDVAAARAASGHWARLARAFRGIWSRPSPLTPAPSAESGWSDGARVVTLGEASPPARPILCVANFETEEDAWHQAAAGQPIESLKRYAQFARFVNNVLGSRPRPDYVLFPELSVPRRWVASLVNRLLDSRIGVIAGVEYGHASGSKEIANEAVLALTDDRLGFPSSVVIWQRKTEAAPGEAELLLRLHGKQLAPAPRIHVVYRHKGFDFALLICSELQDIRNRAEFQGAVDCLMVLAWNKDLETFTSLVDSAALDVHAYIALVNNRKYGDGRVRVPAKEPHLRDVCRIRGGIDDYAVLVRLDVATLRRFQSRQRNWPQDQDPFKPVPQGFNIADRRRMVPEDDDVSG